MHWAFRELSWLRYLLRILRERKSFSTERFLGNSNSWFWLPVRNPCRIYFSNIGLIQSIWIFPQPWFRFLGIGLQLHPWSGWSRRLWTFCSLLKCSARWSTWTFSLEGLLQWKVRQEVRLAGFLLKRLHTKACVCYLQIAFELIHFRKKLSPFLWFAFVLGSLVSLI